MTEPNKQAGRPRTTSSVLLAMLMLVATAQARPQEQSPAVEITRQAEELIRQGRFEEALAEAARALAADESFAGAHFVQGLAYGNLGRHSEARESFIRATELRPGWAEAHRMAALASLQSGEMEVAWEHAIRAQQGGVDMAESLRALQAQSLPPDDLDARLEAPRVFVGGVDATTFEAGGTNTYARSALSAAAGDLFQMQQEMRKKLADSRRFGLVARRELADYVLIFEIDSITTGPRLRGALKLVDARSGENAYRRRVDLSDISSLAYLNRELDRIVGLLEEWAAERQ